MKANTVKHNAAVRWTQGSVPSRRTLRQQSIKDAMGLKIKNQRKRSGIISIGKIIGVRKNQSMVKIEVRRSKSLKNKLQVATNKDTP